MDWRWLAIVPCAVGLLMGASAKTYRRPATVPVAKVVPTSGPVVTMPVPSEKEVAEAIRKVREAYPQDYRAGSATKRREAGRHLLGQGIETRDDSAARYVLLVDAADAAAEAGDGQTVARAVDELGKTFQVDPLEMKAVKLAEAGKGAFTPEGARGVVSACLAAAREALVDERYDVAGRLIDTADAAAERGNQVPLKAEVADRKKELEAIRAGGAEYARAKEVLAKVPGDRAASLAAGRFLCLVKGDWERGCRCWRSARTRR